MTRSTGAGRQTGRFEKVTRLLEALRRGKPAQLGGVRFFHLGGALWAGPEKPPEPRA